MADFLLTSVSAVAQTLNGDESGLITQSGGIYSNGAHAVQMTANINTLNNDGYIYAYGGGFSAVRGGGSNVDFINGANGFISAARPTAGTVDLDPSVSAELINHGSIFAPSGRAVTFAASDAGAQFKLVNTGNITSNAGDAVRADTGGTFSLVHNSGLISGNTGLVLHSATGGGTTHVLTNSGTIEGLDGTAVSFFLGNNGHFRVKNSGTISGETGAIFTVNSTDVQILNSGLIEGNLNPFRETIEFAGGNDVIFNTGTIIGNVMFNTGDDRLDGNGGVMTGRVDAGAGNDTLAGGDAADTFSGGLDADQLVGRGGDDVLEGDGGDDFILGGQGNDAISGGSDNDTVNGNAGDDTILGGDGDDILVGQDGSDQLDGGASNDILDGGSGDDILEGGDGNDILRGRAGEDDLAGGLGRDFLTGGQDADTFVFRSVAETVVGANRDQILDFEQGVDLITVAGLSPGIFEFKGTAAFDTTVPNPELRLFETPTGSTIVQLDNNGDGVADAEIRVANVTGLTAEDFVL